jgi:hypothetical protein
MANLTVEISAVANCLRAALSVAGNGYLGQNLGGPRTAASVRITTTVVLDSILDMRIPQPSFYGPWQEFGLDRLTQGVLQQRVNAYLERVLMRT